MHIAREQIILITPYFESILTTLAKAKHTKPLHHSDWFIWKDLYEKERDGKNARKKTGYMEEGLASKHYACFSNNLTFLMRTCSLESGTLV